MRKALISLWMTMMTIMMTTIRFNADYVTTMNRAGGGSLATMAVRRMFRRRQWRCPGRCCRSFHPIFCRLDGRPSYPRVCLVLITPFSNQLFKDSQFSSISPHTKIVTFVLSFYFITLQQKKYIHICRSEQNNNVSTICTVVYSVQYMYSSVQCTVYSITESVCN